MDKPFDFRRAYGHESDARSMAWVGALESLGPDGVRDHLRSYPGNPPSTVRFADQDVTRGFAQAWLAWHDRMRNEATQRLQADMLAASKSSARAAKAAAIAAGLTFLAILVQTVAAWRSIPAVSSSVSVSPPPQSSGTR